MTMKRIVADLDLCVGAGMCARIAPHLFDQDVEDGRVVLLESEVSPEAIEAAQEAVDCCPSGALSLAEKESS